MTGWPKWPGKSGRHSSMGRSFCRVLLVARVGGGAALGIRQTASDKLGYRRRSGLFFPSHFTVCFPLHATIFFTFPLSFLFYCYSNIYLDRFP